MDRRPTLHEKYTTAGQMMGGYGTVPAHITDNLAYPLRAYQTEAVTRFLFYLDRDQQHKTLPVQLLFNMATGSGKTLVMAALMLELFKRGRCNFIFFVNSTNIIEKTRANFLDVASPKYLFAEKIRINGEPVHIRAVGNFSEARSDAINIVFTTIQGLHSDLNNPRENRLTYGELAAYDAVLLSDEAHHLNAGTKAKKELEDDSNWEHTVQNIMDANRQNMLLEFTATIDLHDAAIGQKYNQRILYQYDLKAFRQDGFSKDVLIYSVDNNLIDRALQAIIISQYRKKVALDRGVWLKPVVLFKSATIKESAAFFQTFQDTLRLLRANDIERQRAKASDLLQAAFRFFDARNISPHSLAAELQNDFSAERLLLVDSNNISGDAQLTLNTLEDTGNEIRAIFAVDMLDEGWDVLNLFDIVRLYDKRDSKNGRPGKTTLREVQLIGRGARYFPFSVREGDERFKRKFDANENEPLRVIEQLHYHSKHNPKYIQELTQQLKESGLVADNTVERELKLKESFKQTPTYAKGVIWQNTRISRGQALQLRAKQARLIEDSYDLPKLVQVTLPSGIGQEFAVFDAGPGPQPDSVINDQATKIITIGKDIPVHIIRSSLNRNKKFTFDHVARAFPLVESMAAFMASKSLLGGIQVEVTGNSKDIGRLNPEQKRYIVDEVLRSIELRLDLDHETYYGSETFEPVPIRKLFTDVRRKFAVSESEDHETGYPQYESRDHPLNLADRDWYVYNENYGTSEEKSLVKTLDSLLADLRKNWDDIYLLRNEKAVRLYDFETGAAFEPDYLLLAVDKKKGNTSWQIFIEPKGGQFTRDGTFEDGQEAWKQRFLRKITDQLASKTLAENADYRVIGLPFYNEQYTKELFVSELKELAG